jgi:hypothetical protein
LIAKPDPGNKQHETNECRVDDTLDRLDGGIGSLMPSTDHDPDGDRKECHDCGSNRRARSTSQVDKTIKDDGKTRDDEQGEMEGLAT